MKRLNKNDENGAVNIKKILKATCVKLKLTFGK